MQTLFSLWIPSPGICAEEWVPFRPVMENPCVARTEAPEKKANISGVDRGSPLFSDEKRIRFKAEYAETMCCPVGSGL